MMYCESCGCYVQDAGAEFCGMCGAFIQKIDNSEDTISNNDISAVAVQTSSSPFKSAIKYGCICIVSFLVIIGIIGGISAVFTSEYSTAQDSNNPPPIITDIGDISRIAMRELLSLVMIMLWSLSKRLAENTCLKSCPA